MQVTFRRQLCLMALMTGLGFIGCATDVVAQDYPSQPITMIVGFAAGGGTDVAARTIAQFARPHLGRAIAVENRPGASGIIGFTTLAKARPDGYTIGFINAPSIYIHTVERPEEVQYRITDFEFVCNVALDPMVFAVREDSPFKTFGEFVQAARSKPGSLVVGADGPKTNNERQIRAMEQALNIQVNYVPYSGAAPALTAALGGHVDATLPSAGEAVPHVEGKKLRALAVFWPKRFYLLPEVPTFLEATGAKVSKDWASLRGIATPKGVPAERVRILENALEKTIKSAEFQAKAKQIGLPLEYMDSKSFKEEMDNIKKEVDKLYKK